MKKLLLAILLFSIISCTTPTDESSNVSVMFNGTIASTGYCKINKVISYQNTIYQCKKGDILEYVDPGYERQAWPYQNSTTGEITWVYDYAYHQTTGIIYCNSLPVVSKSLTNGRMSLYYVIP